MVVASQILISVFRTASDAVNPRPWLRNVCLLGLYGATLASSFFLAYHLRWEFDLADNFSAQLWALMVPVVACKLVLLMRFGQFRSVVSYFGFHDFACVVASTGAVSTIMLVLWYLSEPMATPPRSVIIIDFMLSTGGVTALLLALRYARTRTRNLEESDDEEQRRIGIVGAGDLGSALVCDLIAHRGSGLHPVIFFDDDPRKWNRSMHGVPILGPIARMPELVRLSRICEVVVAMPSASPKKLKEVLDLAKVSGLKASFAPSFAQPSVRAGKLGQEVGRTEGNSGAEIAARRRIFLSPPHMGPDEWALVQEAFASNWIAPIGPHVDGFEQEFAAKHGFAHAAALTSGTAAAHLALRMLGVGTDDEVFCSSLTFVASVTPALMQGARPVFIDSDYATWNMDPNRLAEALEARAKRNRLPKAVIVVDLYGQCADYREIVPICARYEVPIVEDAAEALGATCDGRAAGAFGRCAIFSFNGNKIITTSGGGMLVSDDEHLIRQARFLATQAKDPAPYFEHSQWGYNYRMSNILAAVGRGQLRVLDSRVAARRRICEIYQRALAHLPGITFMPEASFGRSTRWLTCILVDPLAAGTDSEMIRLALDAANIEARPVWKPLHLQPVFRKMGCEVYGGEVSAQLFASGLCLPSGSSMTDEEIERVGSVIQETLGRN